MDTLRVLSDPLRLAILRVLMHDPHPDPPVLSVKEIAATLNEPPTKLYRHMKHLESCGLVEVAETRLVSGSWNIATELRERLTALSKDYFDTDDTDGVPVRLSLIFYSPDP